MKRLLLILTALAATSWFGSHAIAADPPDMAPNVAAAQPAAVVAPILPQGFTGKEAKNADEVRAAVCDLVNQAMTKGQLNRMLVDSLAGTSPKRTALDIKNDDVDQLSGRIEQVRKAFQAKYGQEFDISLMLRTRVLTAQDAVAQGEVTYPNLATTNWPMVAGTASAIQANHTEPSLPAEQERAADRQARLTKGLDVALLQMNASPGSSAITVSLIHPALTRWQVDVPSIRTGQNICNDLTTHLTYLGDHADSWPADVVDGYRLVSHHVLAALYGVD